MNARQLKIIVLLGKNIILHNLYEIIYGIQKPKSKIITWNEGTKKLWIKKLNNL